MRTGTIVLRVAQKRKPGISGENREVGAARLLALFKPAFSLLAAPLRGKDRWEMHRQVEGLRAIPKAGKPLAAAHGQRESEDVFAPLVREATRLVEHLVAYCCQQCAACLPWWRRQPRP